MFNILVLCCVLSYQHTIYFIIFLYILCEANALCLLHVNMFLCCVLFFLDTSILFLCAHSLFYTPCIFVQCAFCQCVHSPAAVCLHRSVCSQVLINPQCACAARVTVLGLCVCVCVCVCYSTSHFSRDYSYHKLY